jgi:mannose-6-phosphate isomerase-like protein (cupin superfamily)
MKQLEAFGIKKVFIRKDTTTYNNRLAPYSGNIEKQTLNNPNYREALYTSKNSQLVVMNLKPRESIGREVHPQDQFFRIEQGKARFDINGKIINQGNGGAVIVPAGSPHNVTNPSKTRELKLYAIYSPSHHPPNTKQKTRPND